MCPIPHLWVTNGASCIGNWKCASFSLNFWCGVAKSDSSGVFHASVQVSNSYERKEIMPQILTTFYYSYRSVVLPLRYASCLVQWKNTSPSCWGLRIDSKSTMRCVCFLPFFNFRAFSGCHLHVGHVKLWMTKDTNSTFFATVSFSLVDRFIYKSSNLHRPYGMGCLDNLVPEPQRRLPGSLGVQESPAGCLAVWVPHGAENRP